jgi:RNA polymerase sigma factor (sigma-70 family)
LRTIAENNLRDAVKELSRQKRTNPCQQVRPRSVYESTVRLLDELAQTSTTASRVAADKEGQQMVREAIARLPHSYRAVVELYDLEGKSPSEVGRMLGRSTGAIHMLRARAHDRLREILGAKSKFLGIRA